MNGNPIDKMIATVDYVREHTPMARVPSEAIEWEQERDKLDAEIERLKRRIGTLEEVLRDARNGLIELGHLHAGYRREMLRTIRGSGAEIERALKDVK